MKTNKNPDLFPNVARQKLDAGELAVGLGVRQGRTSDTAMVAKSCGFDWLFIDMEHNSMDLDAAAQMCVSALPTGVTPIVRVPGPESFHATRILDAGAMGVIVPHVDTPDEARRVADICKFPPLGNRSVPGSMPQLGYAAYSQEDCCRLLNESTLIVVMLETEEAIEAADEIAAIDGIDVLLIGTSDLSADMGIHGQFDHPRIRAAYERVIAACRKHGKHPGMGGIYTPTIMQKYVSLGARFLLGGSDLSLLMQAGRERMRFLDSLLEPQKDSEVA
ncbi:HpcH/HpaI aldolase/citrate lyase family protein [Oceanicola sp. 502str15]|uniref:HpcH/HpaI aldolase family protein n=1 Tax=Oceanicola sp. 502str15 TaxID=2696061 RepID=UPI002094286F|nr:aldolase/citrate lyase family protein [Oceanicola sp. 502str15]MCO6384936.1 aldolase [Oceanicola sp. 502str15]